jgi:hypothetical protein
MALSMVRRAPLPSHLDGLGGVARCFQVVFRDVLVQSMSRLGIHVAYQLQRATPVKILAKVGY